MFSGITAVHTTEQLLSWFIAETLRFALIRLPLETVSDISTPKDATYTIGFEFTRKLRATAPSAIHLNCAMLPIGADVVTGGWINFSFTTIKRGGHQHNGKCTCKAEA